METFKIEMGSTFGAKEECEKTEQYVTMHYRFKPSSVKDLDGVACLSDKGEVELKYNIKQPKVSLNEEGTGTETDADSNSDQVVKLRGVGSLNDDGFTECLLFVNRSEPEDLFDAPSSSSGSKIRVARLERVETRITGLKHERDEQFASKNSANQDLHTVSKRAIISKSNALSAKASKLRAKEDKKIAAQLDAVLASSTDAGVVQLRKKAAEVAALKAEKEAKEKCETAEVQAQENVTLNESAVGDSTSAVSSPEM